MRRGVSTAAMPAGPRHSRSRWPNLRATAPICWCCCASVWPGCSCPRRRSTSACRPTTSRAARAPNQELFPTSKGEREGLTQLIERLQARLGPDQVQRLRPVEDHRPECGSRIEAATGEITPRVTTMTKAPALAAVPAASETCKVRPLRKHAALAATQPSVRRIAPSPARPPAGAAPGVAVAQARAVARASVTSVTEWRAAAIAERPRAHRSRLVGCRAWPSATISSPRPPTARWWLLGTSGVQAEQREGFGLDRRGPRGDDDLGLGVEAGCG